MKKTIFFLSLCSLSLISLNSVNAQRANNRAPELAREAMGNVNQVQQQENIQNPNLPVDDASVQGMTNPSGESEMIGEENGTRGAVLVKDGSRRLTVGEAAKIVKEKNNDVANQVQSLLMEKFQEGNGVKGGIGEQVRTIAQEQLRAQEEIRNRLSQLEERPTWKRFFFGQERSAVIAVDETLEEQSQQLNEWRELLEDPTLTAEERLAIEETILELQAQQELVETHVDNVLGEFNLPNFFRRLFRRS
jgi:hypothetical protein